MLIAPHAVTHGASTSARQEGTHNLPADRSATVVWAMHRVVQYSAAGQCRTAFLAPIRATIWKIVIGSARTHGQAVLALLRLRGITHPDGRLLLQGRLRVREFLRLDGRLILQGRLRFREFLRLDGRLLLQGRVEEQTVFGRVFGQIFVFLEHLLYLAGCQ